MKRLVLCLAIAGAVAVPAAADAKVLVKADCLTASYKPKRIILSCKGGEARVARGITWSTWGGRRARGTDRTGAKLVLSRKRTCRSAQKVYTRAHYAGDRISLGCP